MENDTHSKGDIAKKILKIVFKIIYQIIVILCFLLILIIVFQKITNSNRSIGGYRIFRVITGSMEPEYDVGQVVICKQIPANDIEIGHDIVYLGTYGEYTGKIIMHEVVSIDKDANNNSINFHAKGLHSASVEDPQIKPNQIFGIVKFKSKILTILYSLATSIYSAFVIITILVLNVFLSFKFSGRSRAKAKVHRLEEPEETYVYDENEPEVEAEPEPEAENETEIVDDEIDE